MSNEMRAVRFREYGGSEKLAVETVPRPEPKANEVLVKVRYAGVNPVDWKIRAGYLKSFMPVSLPYTPGIDFAGTVAALGAEASGFAAGDEVFGVAAGTYGEYAIAVAGDIAPIPPGVDPRVAATAPVGALTAWKAVEDAEVADGQTVAVLGAAGGVGLFAAQLAKLKGAKVIGTASAANADFVRGLGVDTVVDYAAADVASRISGVDAVIDTVGGAALDLAYTVVRKGGVVVTVAGQPDEAQAKARGIRIKGSGRGSAEMLRQIGELLRTGKLRGRVGPVFPMSEAAAAHDQSETGHSEGRILIETGV